MRGALEMQNKDVRSAMTRIHDVFMLDINAILDKPTLVKIMERGHSRIPVYETMKPRPSSQGSYFDPFSSAEYRRRLLGCILVKNLLMIELDTPVNKITLQDLPIIQDDLPLYEILNQFERSRTHMAIVIRSPEHYFNDLGQATTQSTTSDHVDHMWREDQLHDQLPIGIITLEDFMEQILEQDILDEKDYVKLNSVPTGTSGFTRLPISGAVHLPITPAQNTSGIHSTELAAAVNSIGDYDAKKRIPKEFPHTPGKSISPVPFITETVSISSQ
ncbi:hypothetical protein V1512DRAFT_130094 [Lipomyces arxii]|uniref:uncharacterized protein n=1 Tax=Lipomyces arxii TaxID=56418 RepID=UPI0034CEEC8E